MIDPKFVQMLCCPIDKTPLKVAGPSLVDTINQAIARGDAFDRIDQKVEQTIDGGLCSGTWLYPIRDNIPSLVADEAIKIDSVKSDPALTTRAASPPPM